MSVTPRDKAKENLKAILIALFAALVLRQFVIASYNVPTGSMKDTIMVGDFMFVNKFIYGARTPSWIGVPFTKTGFYLPNYRFPSITDPKPGDIVVFEYPLEPLLDYIKRCMAIGGQTVEINEGKFLIDGQPEGEEIKLRKDYDFEDKMRVDYYAITRPSGKNYTIRHKDPHPLYNDYNQKRPVTIPENHYYMVGDNRDNSLDSRKWGFVKEDLLVGKPLMIWLSWNTFGVEPHKKIRWDRLGTVLR